MTQETPIHAIGTRRVHPIGIGTWLLEDPDDEQQVQAIRYSLSVGQDHIDTAEMYGSGRTETVVGRALEGVARDSVFLASKLWKQSCTKAAVRPAVEAMLQRLNVTHLDLLYIHYAWPEVDIPGTIESMCDLVDQGLVKALGLSNFQLGELQAAMQVTRHPFVALQNRYNIIFKNETPCDLLKFCRSNGITVVAYQPVERGRVFRDQTVQQVAQAHGVTPAQVAIAWLVRQPGVVTIPKAVDPEHIEDNMRAMDLDLTEDEMHTLSTIPSIS